MNTHGRAFAPYSPTLEHAAATLPPGALEKLRADGRELLRLLAAAGAHPAHARDALPAALPTTNPERAPS